VLRLDVARGYVAMALPAGIFDLLVARWLWRKWLAMHRAKGLMSASVLVVGDLEHLVDLIRALNSVPEAGYRVVAACCGDAEQGSIGEVPVLGDESEAAEVARRIGANTWPAPPQSGSTPGSSGASAGPLKVATSTW